jgi:putative two-component system response regulator
MKLSIRTILIVFFAILISLSLVLIIASSYLSSKNIMVDHGHQIMKNISTFALDKSKTYMLAARDAATFTKELQAKNVISTQNTGMLERYFYEQLKINKQFSGIYFANNKGEFVMVMKNKGGIFFKNNYT